jgi:Tol biopolymer transport system component
VFAYAGDLWSVPRDGGAAARLTSGTGIETDPQFSPDGTHIAFTGEYDGNVDVFVVPAAGGVPKRLTWHPAVDRVLGWTPDGKRIIFGSSRTAYSRFGEMFTVPAEGGVEEKLPLPTGYEASMSADGQSIAYEPTGRLSSCGRNIAAARLRASGSPVSPTARNESTAHEFQRLQPNVVRGPRLFPVGPQWAGDAFPL